jgi:hypothetical protein
VHPFYLWARGVHKRNPKHNDQHPVSAMFILHAVNSVNTIYKRNFFKIITKLSFEGWLAGRWPIGLEKEDKAVKEWMMTFTDWFRKRR